MNTDTELGRQMIHIVCGLIIVLLFYLNILTPWVLLGIVILSMILLFTRMKWKLPVIDKISKPFERKNEKHHYEGPFTFFLGLMIVSFVFEKNIALVGMIIMVVGDGASTMFGKLIGETRLPWSNKSFEGSFFGIIFAFAGASLFVPWSHALIASVVALLVESLDQKITNINDNIIMPVVAGLVLSVLLHVGL